MQKEDAINKQLKINKIIKILEISVIKACKKINNMVFDNFIKDEIEKILSNDILIHDKPNVHISNNSIAKDSINEEMFEIYDFFIKRFPNVNHTIARINTETLVICKLKKSLLELLKLKCFTTYGMYDIISNSIYLKNPEWDSIFEHELYHAYSSYIENNIIYSGFRQYDIINDIEILNYLCESYTMLLENRYNKNDNPFKGINNQSIMLIDTIVGENSMSQLYFSADAKGLVDNLKMYLSEEEIYKYIKLLDIYYLLIDTMSIFNRQKRIDIANDFINQIRLIEKQLIENFEDIKHEKLLLSQK